MLKNENTSVIYVDWFSRENAIIPKKFQSKTFANEPEEQACLVLQGRALFRLQNRVKNEGIQFEQGS